MSSDSLLIVYGLCVAFLSLVVCLEIYFIMYFLFPKRKGNNASFTFSRAIQLSSHFVSLLMIISREIQMNQEFPAVVGFRIGAAFSIFSFFYDLCCCLYYLEILYLTESLYSWRYLRAVYIRRFQIAEIFVNFLCGFAICFKYTLYDDTSTSWEREWANGDAFVITQTSFIGIFVAFTLFSGVSKFQTAYKGAAPSVSSSRSRLKTRIRNGGFALQLKIRLYLFVLLLILLFLSYTLSGYFVESGSSSFLLPFQGFTTFFQGCELCLFSHIFELLKEWLFYSRKRTVELNPGEGQQSPMGLNSPSLVVGALHANNEEEDNNEGRDTIKTGTAWDGNIRTQIAGKIRIGI